MTNSAYPDQLANWSGSTLFAKTGHVVFSKIRVKKMSSMSYALSGDSDQSRLISLPCPFEEAVEPWPSTERPAKTITRRLCDCTTTVRTDMLIWFLTEHLIYVPPFFFSFFFFFFFFTRETIFVTSFFPFRITTSLWKGIYSARERSCSKREQILSFQSRLFEKRRKPILKELPPLKV